MSRILILRFHWDAPIVRRCNIDPTQWKQQYVEKRNGLVPLALFSHVRRTVSLLYCTILYNCFMNNWSKQNVSLQFCTTFSTGASHVCIGAIMTRIKCEAVETNPPIRYTFAPKHYQSIAVETEYQLQAETKQAARPAAKDITNQIC